MNGKLNTRTKIPIMVIVNFLLLVRVSTASMITQLLPALDSTTQTMGLLNMSPSQTEAKPLTTTTLTIAATTVANETFRIKTIISELATPGTSLYRLRTSSVPQNTSVISPTATNYTTTGTGELATTGISYVTHTLYSSGVPHNISIVSPMATSANMATVKTLQHETRTVGLTFTISTSVTHTSSAVPFTRQPTGCPLFKCVPCDHGYVKDENGCQTCQCKEDPDKEGKRASLIVVAGILPGVILIFIICLNVPKMCAANARRKQKKEIQKPTRHIFANTMVMQNMNTVDDVTNR